MSATASQFVLNSVVRWHADCLFNCRFVRALACSLPCSEHRPIGMRSSLHNFSATSQQCHMSFCKTSAAPSSDLLLDACPRSARTQLLCDRDPLRCSLRHMLLVQLLQQRDLLGLPRLPGLPWRWRAALAWPIAPSRGRHRQKTAGAPGFARGHSDGTDGLMAQPQVVGERPRRMGGPGEGWGETWSARRPFMQTFQPASRPTNGCMWAGIC